MNVGWIQASVSMPCTASSQSRCRTGRLRRRHRRRVGASRRIEAGVPQPAHRMLFIVPAIVQFAAARPAPSGRSPARRSGIGTAPRFLRGSTSSSRPGGSGIPCSTMARQRSRRDATPETSSAALSPSCSMSSASTSRAEYVRMPACRDNATRPETVRARAASRHVRPRLRTAGARTRAACCGG